MMPLVYCQVSGGILFACSVGEVEVVEVDWDNIDEADPEDAVFEIERALAQLLPYTNHIHIANAVLELRERLEKMPIE